MANLNHLLYPDHLESGVKNYFLFAPVSYFEADGIKCAPAGEIIITEEHVFKAGKDWIKVLIVPNTGRLTAGSIGETGSKKFMKKYKGLIPGTKEELHATIDKIKHEPLILNIPDADCQMGYFYQLGCDCIFARLSNAEFNTGSLIEGQKGYAVEFDYPSESVKIYPSCENIDPTFNWSFNNNGNGYSILQITNTTILPADVGLESMSAVIFDEFGNEVTTPPFTNAYTHDATDPFLWDQTLSPAMGAYFWIITMTIKTTNGCVKSVKATLDGTTIVHSTVGNGIAHNGTND